MAGILGVDRLGSFTLGLDSVLNIGSSLTTAAQLRAADEQWFCHVLFIEGIPYAWTDDRSGELWGSGVNAWIGNSETDLSGTTREITGQRTILPGLKLPSGLSQARDPKLGNLLSRPFSVTIQDNAAGNESDILAGLFADAEKEPEFLGETIPAGSTNLSASIQLHGSTGGTTNPRGRYIGLERIGPLGERNFFPPFPFDIVGPEHACQPNTNDLNGPPLTPISDAPLIWEGRRVSIYRIFRNPDYFTEDWSAWPLWGEQHNAGNLVAWGKLSGLAKVNGQQEWGLQCKGADSFLQGKLNVNSNTDSFPITANTVLRDEERYASVMFVGRGINAENTALGGFDTIQGSIFDYQLTANTDKDTLRSEIHAFIQDVVNATGSIVTNNVNIGSDPFTNWTVAADDQNGDAGLTDGGAFYITKDQEGDPDEQRFAQMMVVLHHKVWATLGFEPISQNSVHPFEHEGQARFRELEAGAQYHGAYGGNETIPAPNYWEGAFDTIRLGYGPDDEGINWGPETSGVRRYYTPAFTDAETFYLDDSIGQTIRIVSGGLGPYVQGQSSLLPQPGAQVDGSDVDQARLVVFSGKRAPVGLNASDQEIEDALDEAEDYYAVAQVSWVEAAEPGYIADDTDFGLRIDRWLDARAYGFDVRPHDRPWIGNSGAAEIRMQFLGGWPYMVAPGLDQPEYANGTLVTMMLSSGTSTGISGFALDEGENSPNAIPNYLEGGDWEIADLGLAIPYQLVDDPTNIRSVFDDVPGGADGPLNRVRYAYAGAFKAQDVIAGLLHPRRIGWRLHGRQYGVQRLGPKSQDDVDIVITENDLHGKTGDPRSVIPKIEPGRLGAFDDIRINYRWNPIDGGATQGELSVAARDYGARYRSGEIEMSVTDHGLLAPQWYNNIQDVTGVGSWHNYFRQLWQDETAQYFAARHHMVTVTVGPHMSLDCRVGSVVRLTNTWLVTPDGTYGVVNGIGTIEESIQHCEGSKKGAATLKIMMFGGSFAAPAYFGPIAHINGWTGAVLDVDSDFFGHGNPDRHDADGFVAPSWASNQGQCDVEIWQRIGDTWTQTDAGTVASIDTDNDTITLSASVPGGVLRDTDKFLMLRTYDNQGSTSFAREIYGWVCDDDYQHSSTPTDGYPYV